MLKQNSGKYMVLKPKTVLITKLITAVNVNNIGGIFTIF